ncbi:cupin domain-containing protein [Pleurocapsa sp. PCC 7319]|uniref:cupin domain-containing protein n=1 Tax=Pleurocapsa sp. PCC 7319 TaxID=118161 RepID=UPI0003481A56|nr:cupin domain-containing protein [Pleurocapsa sp. PCC 7319]
MISNTLKQTTTATFKFIKTAVILMLLLAGMLITSQSAWSLENASSMIADSSTLNWKPLKGIPDGAKVAVLAGNPAKSASEVVISLPAGYLFPHHSHTSPEILFWSKGEFTYIADDGTKQNLQPDTYLNLPSGTKHSVVCGQEPCLVYARYDKPFDLLLSSAPKNES